MSGEGAPATGPFPSCIVTGPERKYSTDEGKYSSFLWKRSCGAYFLASRMFSGKGEPETRRESVMKERKSVRLLMRDYCQAIVTVKDQMGGQYMDMPGLKSDVPWMRVRPMCSRTQTSQSG